MKVLKVIVNEKPKNCYDCQLHGTVNGICYGVADLAPASGNIPDWCPLEVETDGWFAVSERLPEDMKVVLLATKHGLALTGKHQSQVPQWEASEGYYYHGGSYDWVTHWRPLPEAPKEVKE